MTTSKLPVELPPHWFAEDDWRGTIVHAADKHGHILASVTVNEEVRGYLPGVQQVLRFTAKRGATCAGTGAPGVTGTP